jgi:hypothetical protein
VVSDTDSSLGVMGVKADWKGYISNPHWQVIYGVRSFLVKRKTVNLEKTGRYRPYTQNFMLWMKMKKLKN